MKRRLDTMYATVRILDAFWVYGVVIIYFMCSFTLCVHILYLVSIGEAGPTCESTCTRAATSADSLSSGNKIFEAATCSGSW